jgi:hypothetical protein
MAIDLRVMLYCLPMINWGSMIKMRVIFED